MKWYSHLRTVQHHRFLVLRHCWRVGLYRQGLTHDLSKFSPVEFAAGARYYQGNRSPNEIAASQGPQPSSSGILDRLCGGRLGHVRHENAAEIRA